jgi:CheY-like chemotaxis protein
MNQSASTSPSDSANADVPRASNTQHTVLYIEDNAANIRLVERIFAGRTDIKIVVATQGHLGLDLAREHQPAVVLLDLHLPDIDGEQVLRQLRDDALIRTAPVIVLSADANHRQIQRLLEGGAAAYLTKPLDIHQLVDTVDELISERWPRPMRSEPC